VDFGKALQGRAALGPQRRDGRVVEAVLLLEVRVEHLAESREALPRRVPIAAAQQGSGLLEERPGTPVRIGDMLSHGRPPVRPPDALATRPAAPGQPNVRLPSLSILMSEHAGNTEAEIELEKAEFFRAVAPERLAALRSVLRESLFAPRLVLFSEGDPAEALWAVRRGRVRVYKSSPDGVITTLETLGPGEIFGALSALEGPAYPASAEAVTDGVAWRLPRRQLLREIRDDPTLAVELLGVVARRLQAAHERMRSLAHDPAPARLAQELLRASERGELRLTRRALAEACGTSVETAIRVLRRFQEQGLVRGGVGRIEVLDDDALRALAAAES
jgi:CRP/FNR family transcriptional regulator